MTDDRWAEVVGHIKDTFSVTEEKREDLDDSPGFREWIVFDGPLGTMKLERVTRPLVLGKKTIGSRRIGSTTHVEYDYSSTEKTHVVKAYKWNSDEDLWEKMEERSAPAFYQI